MRYDTHQPISIGTMTGSKLANWTANTFTIWDEINSALTPP